MIERIDKKIADLDFDIKCHMDAIEKAKDKKALWEELKAEAEAESAECDNEEAKEPEREPEKSKITYASLM